MPNAKQRCAKCKKYLPTMQTQKRGLGYVCLPEYCLNIELGESKSNSQNLGLCHSPKKPKSLKPKSKRKAARKSQKIRNSACGEKCTLRISNDCQDGETVVLCHVGRSRGTGLKAHDVLAVFGCAACHDIIDGRVNGGLNKHELNTEILRALEETLLIQFAKGNLIMKGAKECE